VRWEWVRKSGYKIDLGLAASCEFSDYFFGDQVSSRLPEGGFSGIVIAWGMCEDWFCAGDVGAGSGGGAGGSGSDAGHGTKFAVE